MRGSGWRSIIFKMWYYWKVFTALCFLGLSLILITISSWTDTLARIAVRRACKNEVLQSRHPELISVINAVTAEHGHKAQNPSNRQ